MEHSTVDSELASLPEQKIDGGAAMRHSTERLSSHAAAQTPSNDGLPSGAGRTIEQPLESESNPFLKSAGLGADINATPDDRAPSDNSSLVHERFVENSEDTPAMSSESFPSVSASPVPFDELPAQFSGIAGKDTIGPTEEPAEYEPEFPQPQPARKSKAFSTELENNSISRDRRSVPESDQPASLGLPLALPVMMYGLTPLVHEAVATYRGEIEKLLAERDESLMHKVQFYLITELRAIYGNPPID
jgi:hypothetical protein